MWPPILAPGSRSGGEPPTLEPEDVAISFFIKLGLGRGVAVAEQAFDALNPLFLQIGSSGTSAKLVFQSLME